MGVSKETGELIFNPTHSESENSNLDLVVSQSMDKTVMIEAGANQVPEDVMHKAVESAHQETQKIIKGIEELVAKVGQEKLEVPVEGDLNEVVSLIEKSYKEDVS